MGQGKSTLNNEKTKPILSLDLKQLVLTETFNKLHDENNKKLKEVLASFKESELKILEPLIHDFDEQMHKQNLQNLAFQYKFSTELYSSQIEPLSFLKTNVNNKIKSLKQNLPIQKEIKKLFLLHESMNPKKKENFNPDGEVLPDTKVLGTHNIKKGANFFKTITTIPSAAKQKASGLPAEFWFKILSYIDITEGDYTVAPYLTKAYEALIKCRIILDFYQSKNLIRTLQKNISYEEVVNEMPFEALDIFYEDDNGKSAEIERAIEKERLDLHRAKENLKKMEGILSQIPLNSGIKLSDINNDIIIAKYKPEEESETTIAKKF